MHFYASGHEPGAQYPPDFVLSNGALVEFKTRRDKTGAAVVTRIEIWFPKGAEIPLGGINSSTLREIPLSYITSTLNVKKRILELTPAEEEQLLELLRDYPSSPGRVPVDPVYLAATAYFFEKFMGQEPYNPNVALSAELGVPVRTITTRVGKARSLGFLMTGTTTRVGGQARGALTYTAQQELLRFLGKTNS
jgi:hypothetical protein